MNIAPLFGKDKLQERMAQVQNADAIHLSCMEKMVDEIVDLYETERIALHQRIVDLGGQPPEEGQGLVHALRQEIKGKNGLIQQLVDALSMDAEWPDEIVTRDQVYTAVMAAAKNAGFKPDLSKSLFPPKMVPIPDYGDLMTMADFISSVVDVGVFVDDGGYGKYSDGAMMCERSVNPSGCSLRSPRDAMESCGVVQPMSARQPSAVGKAYKLHRDHNILITCFSFDYMGQRAFRFYFRDNSNGHIHNPMVEGGNGKKSFPIYTSYEEGLTAFVQQAREYLKTRKP